MRVAYLGNFRPAHSTENHVGQAVEHLGHELVRLQENDLDAWQAGLDMLASPNRPDVVLWTRTGWDPPIPHDLQHRLLGAAVGVPVVGYHLDRWWGLGREGQIREEPFFRAPLVVTADGGHDAQWEAANVTHHFMPPGVSEFECAPGTPNRMMASEIAFVGSWRPGYHAEWTHRPELIGFLNEHYGRRCRLWPPRPGRSLRGKALRDLYASVQVVVGDSCLVGDEHTGGELVGNYWSDRIPETIGRGAFLLHPHVEGLREAFTEDGAYYGPQTWPVGDWDGLAALIDDALANPAERVELAAECRAHVLRRHTYTARMRELFDTVLPTYGLL